MTVKPYLGIRASALSVVLSLPFSIATTAAQAGDAEESPRSTVGVDRSQTPATESDSQTERSAPSEADQVQMPELLQFQPAPYPAEAQQMGIEGDVILELTIDAEGSVTDAQVKHEAGHGFDEAARRAALRFHFQPAFRGGEAIAAKILYKYSFTLESTEPPEPPPTQGNLAGSARVAATDAPLAGMEVVITTTDGRELRTFTDAEGHWTIEDLPAGRYRVAIAAPGSEAFEAEETVVAGETTEVVYRVITEPEGLDVTIVGERPPREVTLRTLQRREIERIPGTNGDALRSIQSLPGVARPPALAGLLIVRGSAPEDTASHIDSTRVPIMYHFGGLSSVVPTELLDKIDFYPGSFGAPYGTLMGGIVDVALRKPDVACYEYGKTTEQRGCYHGLAQLDLVDGRVLAQGPLGPLQGWSFAIGGRRSWVDAWITPVLEEAGAGVTSAPVYQDYQLILHNEMGPTSDFRLQAYGSSDKLELIVDDPAAQDPAFGGNLRYSTRFWRIQSIYETELAPEVTLYAMLSAGEDTIGFSLGTFLLDLTIYPITARSEFNFKLSPYATLNAGLDFSVAPFEVLVRTPPPPRPGEPDPGPFATRVPLEGRTSQTAFRPGWYADVELTPGERWRIVPAIRLDYARDTGHADFSPRLNARYRLVTSRHDDPSVLATTLKGGVGVYQQPPQFQETNEPFGTPGLESNHAIHYSLGVEQGLSEQVELSAEGFYKDMSNLVVRRPVGSSFEHSNDGAGYSVGLETLLKYRPDERFFGWASYTLSRSVRQDFPGEEEYLFQFDQTHNLILLGSYRLGRGWEFGARFRVVSGPLDTPVVGPPSLPALYAADAGAYTPLQGKPFSRRLPLFHQLDLRLEKRWQFQAWRLTSYLDVQNAYNNAAAEAIVYNYDFSESVYQTGLPILPSLGVKGEF